MHQVQTGQQSTTGQSLSHETSWQGVCQSDQLYLTQLQELAAASIAITSAPNLQATLQEITVQARNIIGAHQAVVQLNRDKDMLPATAAASFSEKYAAWSSGTVAPDKARVCSRLFPVEHPVRMTQEELEAHSGWEEFIRDTSDQPPLCGCLAVPLICRNGRGFGILQLSDKYQNGFTQLDEAILAQIAQFAAIVIEKANIEQDLREWEYLTKTLTDHVTSGLFVTDAKGYCTFMNRAGQAMTGFNLEEARTAPMHEQIHHMHPDGRPFPISECPLSQAIRSHQKIQDYKGVFIRKDGTFFPVSCNVEPIVQNGMLINSVIEVRDITEEKKAEDSLRASEERFRTMADASPMLICLINPQGTLTYVNKRIVEFTGAPYDEILANGWGPYVHPDDYPRVAQSIMEALENGGYYEMELRCRRFDGNYGWLLVTGMPVMDANGRLLNLVSSSIDITQRKLAEQNLLAYKNQLEQSNKELENFATIASHDLQAPLRKVQVFTNHLKCLIEVFPDLPDDALDDIERISKSTHRMQALIQDLLILSRITRKAGSFVKVDLAEVLNEVIEELEEDIEKTNATITVSAPLGVIDADKTQMYQLFQNLINNALKFQRPGINPVIQVDSRIVDNEFRLISIRDEGIGFKQEYAERIFGIFQRLHGQNHYAGTGIGLAICKRIVERHQGAIWTESMLNEGTTFFIKLPIRQKHSV